jgi:hypothetical protein
LIPFPHLYLIYGIKQSEAYSRMQSSIIFNPLHWHLQIAANLYFYMPTNIWQVAWKQDCKPCTLYHSQKNSQRHSFHFTLGFLAGSLWTCHQNSKFISHHITSHYMSYNIISYHIHNIILYYIIFYFILFFKICSLLPQEIVEDMPSVFLTERNRLSFLFPACV